MLKIKSATRLAITIGIICATMVWMALGLSLVPDPHQMAAKNRVNVTKAIAVTVSSYAESRRYLELEKLLERNLAIDPNIVSIGVRRKTGNHLLVVGPHHKFWDDDPQALNINDQIVVDILANSRPWGQLEILFRAQERGLMSLLFGFPFGMIGFLTCGLTLLTWLVLGRTFKYLNPANVVPSRVRSALDSLSGGLVLMTNDGEIAHANKSFGTIVQCDNETILGKKLSEFEWADPEEGKTEFPWDKCRTIKNPVSGEIVESDMAEGITQKYMVNAAPIYGSQDAPRGVLVSFEDVTALESKKAELAKIIQTVRMSRDEVERQNEQLNFLASYDPLTKCMNRRAFFGHYERQWAEDESNRLSLVMLDIDHFKSINDNHGHSAGDQVLTTLGDLLNRVVANQGLVCRYGGEEFVILMRDMSFEECSELAESIRHEIEKEEIAGLLVTASLGISCRSFGPMDPQHMLDQADQCLYAAKRNGRNQLVSFDNCPAIVEEEETEVAEATQDSEHDYRSDEIEYSAVTGLLSALSFRCSATAEHSVRVADLCVAIAQPLMSHRELYKLEIAGLLHDVGKIGVPDAILNKPGKLTKSEWEIMQQHDEIGVAIVRSAFASEEVARTIERHHSAAINNSDPECPPQQPGSLSSQILSVCDAFDSMVTDQVYRPGMSVKDALAEIQRNTPSQFEATVVDQLKKYINSGCYESQRNQSNARILPDPTANAGEHVDALYEAIAKNDLGRVESIVGDIKHESADGPMTAAAEWLGREAKSKDVNFDTLLALADEVMELCRETRSSFITPKPQMESGEQPHVSS